MQRKMRAQRSTSDGERLVETAIKMGANRDSVTVSGRDFQRAVIGDKLADFVRRWLTVEECAMIAGALMLVVAVTLGIVPDSVLRDFRQFLIAMRAARACLSGNSRFGAAIHFARMCMMHTAAKCHMHD